MAVDPIEKKPLFHFRPGSRCFSIGGWGCNFRCPGCQNWPIACPPDRMSGMRSRSVLPAAAVELALRHDCQGIAWTYNEPTVWFEYTLDSARLAKARNLYTVYVTNGYMTPEALDLIAPHLDAWRVDVKGFGDPFFNACVKVPEWRGILDTTRRARDTWNLHVEVVTNIMPGLNDDDAQLRDIAGWIAKVLGVSTPWHVTRFHPQRDLRHVPVTPVATIERACRIGRDAGLRFVYAGNVPGHASETTRCPACDSEVVSRHGYAVRIAALDGARCGVCGADLNFK